ncbi:RBBP8 N-terminal-like protein [Saccopteryx bilineata]|uniref:RBBP8 N-terminal-like protein n=1 Tax=Saccopteryx bilineata TaxID=59482 RepID=UPI00338DDAA8
MESFMESLNRLRDLHEKEVLGLQNKLVELNSERCRDAQRVEELCAKNHQLREQQRALKDNVRVLENRLRAGLCDRCTVTQELARKKQQEFESSLLQNLQHVFILTNEMTRLQEENESLKEEVTRLRGLGPRPQGREGALGPASPPLLASPGARKAVTEKLPGGCEESEDHPPEKLGHRTSPVARLSPGASLPEPRAPDMSPQRISNQLHGTIAVVRPGAWVCSADRATPNGTPPAGSSPPSPPHELGLPLNSFLRASRPPSLTYESLKHPLQADAHLSLKLRSPHRSPRVPAAAPGRPRHQGLKAGEEDAWEEPLGLLGLPGALVDMRDRRLEGALSLLLAQQLQARGQAGGAKLRGPPRPGETLPSPPVGSDSEGPEGEAVRAALPGRRHPRPTGPGSPRGKEAAATQDHIPDKPLDLSEWGRSRDAPKPMGHPEPLSPQTAHTPSPEPPRGVETPAPSGPWGRSSDTQGARAPESEEPPTLENPPHPLLGPQPSLPSPGRTGDESRERSKPSPHPQRPDADIHPELSKVEGQRPAPDEPDELDASDSEVGLSPEAEATPGERPRCFCSKEPRHGPPQKRKRTLSSDLWDTASKKPS